MKKVFKIKCEVICNKYYTVLAYHERGALSTFGDDGGVPCDDRMEFVRDTEEYELVKEIPIQSIKLMSSNGGVLHCSHKHDDIWWVENGAWDLKLTGLRGIVVETGTVIDFDSIEVVNIPCTEDSIEEDKDDVPW